MFQKNIVTYLYLPFCLNKSYKNSRLKTRYSNIITYKNMNGLISYLFFMQYLILSLFAFSSKHKKSCPKVF